MKNQFSLEGRLALITGSSAGIGFALARGLAQAGATVVLNARNEHKLVAAAGQLRSEGFKIHYRCFDVTQEQEVQTAVHDIEKHIGEIDILINNAGMQRRAPLEEFKSSDWHELMRTNVDSVFLVGQAVAKAMIHANAEKSSTFARCKASWVVLTSRLIRPAKALSKCSPRAWRSTGGHMAST